MSEKSAQQLMQLFEAFKADFDANFVPANPRMSRFSIAVFADGIKVVPSASVLAGGPDFVRIFCEPRLYSLFLSHAAEQSSADLLMIMRLLGGARKTSKKAKLIANAATRFMTRAKDLQNSWLASRSRSAAH